MDLINGIFNFIESVFNFITNAPAVIYAFVVYWLGACNCWFLFFHKMDMDIYRSLLYNN